MGRTGKTLDHLGDQRLRTLGFLMRTAAADHMSGCTGRYKSLVAAQLSYCVGFAMYWHCVEYINII